MGDMVNGAVEQRIDPSFNAEQRQEILALCRYLEKVGQIPEDCLDERPPLYFTSAEATRKKGAV